MIFDCGHNKSSGVGQRCMDCHTNNIPLPKSAKPKGVIGRPVTKSAEHKAEKKKQWQADNRLERNEYHKKRARLKRGVVKGQFVIEHEGDFKRSASFGSTYKWGSFNMCHTYQSLGKANVALRMAGKGVVMRRMDTEALTLSNFKANGLNEPVVAK